MPSFSFAPVAKPTKVHSHAESSSKYNIIVPNTEGTVFINLKGEYYILIGNDKYDIAEESYSCKGVSEVYLQELDNGKIRFRYIRSERDRRDMDRTMYLPFISGCSVKGNIVRYKSANTIIFKIKKVYLDFDDPIGREAIKFYRDNYVKIRKYIDNNTIKQDIIIDEEINE